MGFEPHAKLYRSGEVVEAIQLSPSTISEAVFWTGGRITPDEVEREKMGVDEFATKQVLIVPILEGHLHVSIGEFLVKDEDGRFDKMSPEEFEQKYVKFFNPRGGLLNLPRNFRKHAEKVV